MRPIAALVRTLAKQSIARQCQVAASQRSLVLTLARGAASSSTTMSSASTGASSRTSTRSQQNSYSTLSEPVVELETETSNASNVTLEPLAVDADEGSADQFANLKTINDFNLSPTLLRNLERAGVTHFFPVQAQSFSIMMKGEDIVGRSKTGSGKTLAFGIPIIEKLLACPRSRTPQALILLPTRELAQQVLKALEQVGPQLRLVNVVGGEPYQKQERDLQRGCDVLVGTPGRIIDLMKKGTLDLNEARTVILDEADMMLKFGFQEEVETIFRSTPEDRQCVMWSATFPKWVESMAKKFAKNAVSIDLVGKDDNKMPSTVAHKAIMAPNHSRMKILENVLRQHAKLGQALVFTETKQETDDIASALGKHDARALHGDLSQGMRTSTMQGFRDGSIRVLVCTDVAARGLDIASVDLVVQYRLPNDKESFVHRAGRTGRAGRSGTNIVFFDSNDAEEVFDFEKRYQFHFTHLAPPSVEQVVNVALEEVEDKLQHVSAKNTALFDQRAEQLLQDKGVKILSNALALLCGFDSRRMGAMSMLTGRSGMQTMQFVGFESIRDAAKALAVDNLVDRRDLKTISDGRVVADVQVANLQKLEETCEELGVQVSLVEELPRVLVPTQPFRRRSNGDDFAGRRNQRGGGGGGFGGFGSSRGNDRFDRNNRTDRRNDRRSNSWSGGRHGDNSRSDRGSGNNPWRSNNDSRSNNKDRRNRFDEKFSNGGSSSKKDWRNFDW